MQQFQQNTDVTKLTIKKYLTFLSYTSKTLFIIQAIIETEKYTLLYLSNVFIQFVKAKYQSLSV